MKVLLPTICAAAIAAACINAREGSTVVYVPARGTNDASASITAAATGANAQNSGAMGTNDGRGQSSMSFASKWYLWLLVGIGVVLIGWVVWKFVFTGAKIMLVR